MSKLKSIDEILAGWDGLDRPQIGARYRHFKGGEYEIVATGFLENSEEPCVIYRSLAKDIVWVRPAQNFLENIEHQGHTIPRFTKLSQTPKQ